jgi:hypothetical protein
VGLTDWQKSLSGAVNTPERLTAFDQPNAKLNAIDTGRSDWWLACALAEQSND